MIVPDPLPVTLAPGASETRTYSLVVADEPGPVLGEIYREFRGESGTGSVPVAFEFSSESVDSFELVVREAGTAALFYRAFLDRPGPLTIELPQGRYVAEARFFPGIARCSFEARGQGAGCRLSDPPLGRAALRVVDRNGGAVPGKVTFSSSVTSSRSADSASGGCVGAPCSLRDPVYGRRSSYSLAALRPSMQ
jgi:hypothetical protein